MQPLQQESPAQRLAAVVGVGLGIVAFLGMVLPLGLGLWEALVGTVLCVLALRGRSGLSATVHLALLGSALCLAALLAFLLALANADGVFRGAPWWARPAAALLVALTLWQVLAWLARRPAAAPRQKARTDRLQWAWTSAIVGTLAGSPALFAVSGLAVTLGWHLPRWLDGLLVLPYVMFGFFGLGLIPLAFGLAAVVVGARVHRWSGWGERGHAASAWGIASGSTAMLAVAVAVWAVLANPRWGHSFTWFFGAAWAGFGLAFLVLLCPIRARGPGSVTAR